MPKERVVDSRRRSCIYVFADYRLSIQGKYFIFSTLTSLGALPILWGYVLGDPHIIRYYMQMMFFPRPLV